MHRTLTKVAAGASSALAILLAAASAHATLIGDTFQITEFYPDLGNQFGNAVGPFTVPVGGYSTGAGFSNIVLTLADSTITLAGLGTYNSATFNGFEIKDLSPTSTITGISLASGSFALPSEDYYTVGNSIFINVQGQNLTSNIVLDVSSTTGTPGVPEPATWAMMLLGFGALGLTLRTRRTRATVAAG